MTEKPKFGCPSCGETVSLWEGGTESGFWPVDEYLERTGPFETNGAYQETTGEWGCGECSWVGPRSAIEKLGIDGKPLPFIHPNQTTLEGAVT